MTTREFFEEATLSRDLVDRFLDENANNWAKFDAELGYGLRDCVVQDGVDKSYTLAHYENSGERRMVHYAVGQACRINTYGNSFTQCHQVSDGETWQEYLASHFGEPMRNFGVGGYGVYQAYRRMRREEATSAAAEYVILNIWSDDHYRSVMAWRWLHIPEFRRHMLKNGLSKSETCMFHANPWAHVRLNIETGLFEEYENPYPTPEVLYQLCDTDYVYETFRDDGVVQALLAQQGVSDAPSDKLDEIAKTLALPIDYRSSDNLVRCANTLMTAYALRSSMYIIEEAIKFTKSHGKQLLILLSYDINTVIRSCQDQPRFDQALLDYLDTRTYPYIDTLKAHREEYDLYQCDPKTYADQYYIGHYNPKGNHFFAFAIKDRLVDWLIPQPPTYRDQGPSLQTLAGKLA